MDHLHLARGADPARLGADLASGRATRLDHSPDLWRGHPGHLGMHHLDLRAVHLYCGDVGVWVYSGVLPWNKGVAGVKWRNLDEAVYFQGP